MGKKLAADVGFISLIPLPISHCARQFKVA